MIDLGHQGLEGFIPGWLPIGFGIRFLLILVGVVLLGIDATVSGAVGLDHAFRDASAFFVKLQAFSAFFSGFLGVLAFSYASLRHLRSLLP